MNPLFDDDEMRAANELLSVVIYEWPCPRCGTLTDPGELEAYGGECEGCRHMCLICTSGCWTPEQRRLRRCLDHLDVIGPAYPDRCPDCNALRQAGVPTLPHAPACPWPHHHPAHLED